VLRKSAVLIGRFQAADIGASTNASFGILLGVGCVLEIMISAPFVVANIALNVRQD